MTEFWEDAFQNKKEMWGHEPASSALIAKDIFFKDGANNLLIPGVGYGRNAKPFIESGIKVTGIEISQTAIELARIHFGNTLTIHQGNVTDMPFDDYKYDGIFCHALIHLLDKENRAKLIKDCYKQLKDNCYMIFTVISKDDSNFKQGVFISKDRYEIHKGVKLFFYDVENINFEFKNFGLLSIDKVSENQPMYLIICKKNPKEK